jgi:hypothetical protein
MMVTFVKQRTAAALHVRKGLVDREHLVTFWMQMDQGEEEGMCGGWGEHHILLAKGLLFAQ